MILPKQVQRATEAFVFDVADAMRDVVRRLPSVDGRRIEQDVAQEAFNLVTALIDVDRSHTDDELWGVLKGRRDLIGAIPGPFEAWLTLRGLRTLHLRVERAQANAQELVRRLGEHPALSEVRYPGFGGIVSIVLAQGEMAADLLSRKTRLWVHATSLGGVESTLERRRRWKAEAATIPDGLVRMSVGIEDVEDLWADLEQGLAQAALVE